MKHWLTRAISLLTALCLLPCLASAEEVPEAAFVYESDFSAGTDGWYARSSGGAVIEATAEGLRITNRSATWHSPGRDFPLVAGRTYELSVEVKQDELPEGRFILSVAHTRGGEESYENIVSETVKQGAWTRLSASYIPGEFDRYVLYVEGGAKDTSFTIRHFSCKEKGEAFDTSSLPSLKALYADRFDFGTAVVLSEVMDSRRMAFYGSQFSIMTPGNEMKPESLLDMTQCRLRSREDDTAVAVRFDRCIPLLDWCRDNGVKVHGHVLVWHSQTPEAFFHEGYDVSKPLCSRDTMLARMEHYIQQVLTWTDANYPGLIVSWDVVNEAIADDSDQLRESNWTRTVGSDFVSRAFAYARQYAADGVMLYYNDYNTPFLPKLQGICALLDTLLAEGTIDGYGFQAHYAVNNPTIAQVEAAFQQVSARKLRLRVSELDVCVDDASEASFQRQAAYYGALMAVFLRYAERIDAVQVWGTVDNLSWRASRYPLLFDQNAQPKPAFTVLAEMAQ